MQGISFKMDKLKGSIITKMAAWIVCVGGAVATLFFSVLTYIGIEEDLFNFTYEELLEDAYCNTNMQYSLSAFHNMGTGYENALASEGFQYGIIKGITLDTVDFHDRQSYIETNMTDEEFQNLDKDKLYLCHIREREDGTTECSKLGYIGNYESLVSLSALAQDRVEQASEQWVAQYADIVCYDTAKGIFYYRSENYYYPAQIVTLTYNVGDKWWLYDYAYDFELGAYRFHKKHILVEGSADKELKEDVDLETGDLDSASIDTILQGDSNNNRLVDFSRLEGTQFDYKSWEDITLDNVRPINGNELIAINSEEMEKEYFISHPNYYLDENYTLHVKKTIDINSYWVASLVPRTPVENSTSEYHTATWALDIFYAYGQNAFRYMIIAAIMTFVSFIFLAFAAGHRKNRQEIVLTWFDKIPLELFAFLIGCAEVVVFYIVVRIVNSRIVQDIPELFLKLVCACVVFMVALFLFCLLSFCVRMKSRTWWQNSILYRVFNPIKNVIVSIVRNLNILKKMIFLIGVISLGEFAMILTNPWGTKLMVFWFFEKLVLCVAIFLLAIQMHELQIAGEQMAEGNLSYKVDTTKMFWECRKHGENLNRISEGMTKAVNERMKSERFKTELITNVSHDIKTPLTSIINYVDLLRREELNNEKASEYLEVLDRQSTKLKKLLEDLVEASKASTGNLPVESERLEAGVFLIQTVGEFEEKLSNIGLKLIIKKPEEPVYIIADGRHLWRVTDNLMSNIYKYAQPDSRVYVTLEATNERVEITFRNMSKYPLNISGEELMERFVRGDKSRNDEGHGLGLSIAKSLTELMGGEMYIIVDGDLFKVILAFQREPNVTENTTAIEI